MAVICSDYDKQCCYKILYQKVEYYAIFPKSLPGVYLVIGRQYEMKGCAVYTPGDEVLTIPILEYSAPTFRHSIRSLWAILPGVAVLMPGDVDFCEEMAQKVVDDLDLIAVRDGPTIHARLIHHPVVEHHSIGLIRPSNAPEKKKIKITMAETSTHLEATSASSNQS